MPRPQRDNQGQVKRIFKLLIFLSGANGYKASSEEICSGIKAYHGESGKRLYRHDIEKLKKKGLIKTQIEGYSNRSGVMLNTPLKPQYLFLTIQEHQLLSKLRDSKPNPSSLSPGSLIKDFDLAWQLLRYLEEKPGQKFQLEFLSNNLSISLSKLEQIIESIADEDDDVLTELYNLHPGIKEFVFTYDENILEKDKILTVGLDTLDFLDENSILDSTKGTGNIGLFAYTIEEIDDRLSLINEALSSPSTNDIDKELLKSASDKLLQWRSRLIKS